MSVGCCWRQVIDNDVLIGCRRVVLEPHVSVFMCDFAKIKFCFPGAHRASRVFGTIEAEGLCAFLEVIQGTFL